MSYASLPLQHAASSTPSTRAQSQTHQPVAHRSSKIKRPTCWSHWTSPRHSNSPRHPRGRPNRAVTHVPPSWSRVQVRAVNQLRVSVLNVLLLPLTVLMAELEVGDYGVEQHGLMVWTRVVRECFDLQCKPTKSMNRCPLLEARIDGFSRGG